MRRSIAVLAAIAVSLTILGVTPGDPAEARKDNDRPTVHQDRPKELEAAAPGRLPARSDKHDAAARRAKSVTSRAVRWPSAAEGVLDSAAKAASGRTLSLGPVSLTTTAVVRGSSASKRPVAQRVRVLDRAATDRTGIQGVVVEVSRQRTPATAATTPTGSARIAIDYSGFGHAYGADWPGRLKLFTYPGCLLTTPQRPACQVATPIASKTDSATRTVTGTVPAAQLRTTSTVVALAAVAASSSGTGDFSATPMAQSSSWTAGGSSGDFGWSYPISTVPANNGPAPSIDLSYSSQSVDGRTASTNNQASRLGEGWDVSGDAYIERGYATCKDDGVAGKYDLCWKTDNAHLVLNGHSGELIKRSDGTWRLSTDDGSRARRLTSTATGNQDNDKEYWELTTSDGTKYYFGRTAVPDQTGDTQSVWWVPVNGNNSGEPCYSAGTTYATRFCKQAWRWNLDYVVDPHGNAMSYWYAAENNYYAKNQVASPASEYIRGGRLTRIDYGLRAGSTAAAPFQVGFTSAFRCLAATGCDTYSKAKWPDTPYDQICGSTATCTGKFAPTFFTRYRLTKITTKIRKSAAYSDVDSWTFDHEFLNPGDVSDSSLWLRSITHAGLVGGTITEPSITFDSVQLANRANALADGISNLPRYRIHSATSESGAFTQVYYSTPQCDATTLPTPDDNTKLCFPQKWTPDGSSSPRTDWFNKFVVTDVTVADTATGVQSVQTHYAYGGGGAWAYDDNKLIADSYRTWSQWRGYGEVTATVGNSSDSDERSQTTTTYFRGMDGDKQTAGTPRSVSVDASDGTTVTDKRAYAGRVREKITYDKAGGSPYSGVIYTPWSTVTAGSGLKAASFVGTAQTRSRSILANGQWQRRIVDQDYDDDTGQVTRVSDSGDTGVSGDETCAATSYADVQTTTGAWFVGFPSRVVTSRGTCASDALTPTEADVLSDTRTRYDNLALGASPTRGLVTGTDRLKEYQSGAPVYQQVATNAYDAYGRPTSTTTPSAQGPSSTSTDTTAYTMSTDGTLASTTSTEDAGGKGFVTTTTNAPEWGVPAKIVDPNNKPTEAAYDALGRVVSVWDINRARTATPSTKYAYTISKTSASSVRTSRLNTDGTAYIDSYQLYDSLLRPLQTQTPTPSGERILTGILYDSRGQQQQTYADVYATGAPSGTLAQVVDGSSPALTKNTIDGLGRVTKSTLVTYNTPRWSTTTTYDGSDVTTVTPPGGAPPVTTTTDIRGRKTKSVEHGTPDLTTTYQYDLRNNLVQLTSPGGTWTYDYDLRGRKVEAVDPDAGTTTTTYTESDAVATTTDARGKTLLTTYDNLGRNVAQYDGATADDAKLLKGWTYDTLAKGYPYAQTRYLGGKTGDRIETKVVDLSAAYQPAETKLTLTPAAGSTRFQGLPSTLSRSLFYNLDKTLSSQYLPKVAVGSTTVLAEEPLIYEYNSLGLTDQIRGQVGIVQDVVYNQLSQPQQVVAGRGSGYQLFSTREYDEGTNRLTRSLVTSNLSSTVIADPHYSYDDAGNPTKVADTANADTQCYRYDDHRRLSNAWTPADGSCATAPASATLGGPAPYRQSWTFTPTGLRDTQTTETPSGIVADDLDYPAATDPHRNFATGLTRTSNGTTSTLAYAPDAAGNTTTRPGPSGADQALDWDSEGNLTKLTETAGDTTYVYDIDGVLLLKENATSKVLYAGDTEVTYNKTTSATTAKRTYDTGLGILAVRHGNAAGDLTFQVTDGHGTAQVSLDATTLVPVYRRQTPYGEDRGPQPSNWPNERSFLNMPADKDTGLTSVGVRDYDPILGRFISVDPLLMTDSPAQMLGYSYGNNNPNTYSDPSGAGPACGGEPCPGHYTPGGTFQHAVPQSHDAEGSDNKDSSGRGGLTVVISHKPKSFHKTIGEYQGFLGKVTFALEFVAMDVSQCEDLWSKECAFEVGPSLIPGGKGVSRLGGVVLRKSDEVEDVAKHADEVAAASKSSDEVAAGTGDVCKVNSFTGDTPVLMADRTTKPIRDVRLGELVLATDPITGETSARRVSDLIRHSGVRTIVRVRLDGGETIDATDQHPFWVVNSKAWVYAIDLEPGDRVATADGFELKVASTWIRAEDLTAYNLTVAGMHTYFVGDDHVLVHNCRRPTAAVRKAADEAATDANGVLRCQICNIGLLTRAGSPNSREFDHILPFARGGGRDIDNIWDLCRTCNRKKGAKTLDELGWP